jgi:putative flavoprotein involved in K+ transport
MSTLVNDGLAVGEASIDEVAATWVGRFAAAVEGLDLGMLDGLLIEGATWRDFVSFTWDLTHYIGRDQVREALARLAPGVGPTDFTVSSEQPPVELDGNYFVYFDFVTKDRVNRGLATLIPVDGQWLAVSVFTQVEGLAAVPWRVGERRPEGKKHAVVKDRPKWAEERVKESAFLDGEPSVVILGAGHNGLALAARLRALGVSTLVFDSNERVGDTWRRRYDALALHSSINVDDLPYYPFPPTWTAHTPKDKFADHLESYARAMDLNVWTGTTLESASYDEATERWSLLLRSTDGSHRTVHPRQFVVAAGLNGAPNIPAVEDLEVFEGETMHSDEYKEGSRFAGKNILVVGAGVSAHELAQDLYEHGASVTMLQRGETVVCSMKNYNIVNFGIYDAGLATDSADLIAQSMPFPALTEVFQDGMRRCAEFDRELLDRLEARGFKTSMGPNGTGPIGNHLQGKDSYQLDCGASELIANGSVTVKHGVEIARATKNGVVFTDGSELTVDAIIFATGYHSILETIRPLLGDAVNKIDQVYVLDDKGEQSNVYRPTPQPGLWFATGFVGTARFNSKRLAVLLAAVENEIIPNDVLAHTEPTT